MSSVCGFVGIPGQDAARRVDDMARADPAFRAERVRTLTAPGAAVAGLASHDVVDVHETHGMIAAVGGTVTWTSDALAAVARGRGTAAAAAEAYASEGAGCLQGMRGAFVLAIVDPVRNRALLAIDPLGIRSLYFARMQGGVVFGSRAAQVVARGAGKDLDAQAIFDYLYSHVVPSPRTIYRDVGKIEAGECVEWHDGALRRTRYWQLPYRDEAGEAPRELEERLRGLLADSVARSVRNPAVGAFLSGGTDSSTVVGMLARTSATPVDTYSIGFAVDGFDELDYARVTARHFRCTPHEHYLTPQDVVAAIPRIAAFSDEPFGNASVVAAYVCARMAAADGKELLLAGDGGDEIFGGNARYAKQQTFELYQKLPVWLRAGLLEPVANGMPDALAVGPVRKARSYIAQARVPLPDRLETYNFLVRDPLAEIFAPDFLAAIDAEAPIRSLRETYHGARSRAAINRMMHLDLKITLADNDLRKVGIACELAGVGVAYPLLDQELVDFTGRIPADQKVYGTKLRYLFKNALRDFLPPETIAKRKHGFGLPFGVWVASDPALRALAFDSLASFRRRGYVRTAYLDRLSARHSQEHATYYGVMLWVLMMLEQWLAARGR